MTRPATETPRALLEEILPALLADEDDFFEIGRSLDRLGTFCADVTGYNGRNEDDSFRQRTWTDYGVAIGPDQAAACLREQLRTKRFLQGAHAGIEAARARFPGEPVRVLYAGCGPYALLALPFIGRYTPDQLAITLLDLHPESLTAVRKLTRALGLAEGEYFTEFVEADATRYRPPADQPLYHVLISETMCHALIKETQVAITANLIPFLHPQGTLVPEAIHVEAVLADPGYEVKVASGSMARADATADQRVLGTALRLDARTATAMRAPDGSPRIEPEPLHVALPEDRGRHRALRLRTTIRVHGNLYLHEGDTSLTLPYKIQELDDREIYPDLELRYIGHGDPRYEWNLPKPTPRVSEEFQEQVNTGSGPAHRRLPLTFDPERLRADLEGVLPEEWFHHYERRDYEGTWEVAALHALLGLPEMIYAAHPLPPGVNYAATPLLRRSPYFQEVLDQFQCELSSVRLLRPTPQFCIPKKEKKN